MATDELRERLQSFLIQNPETDIAPGLDGPAIKTPWGDESLELRLSPVDSSLIDTLNSVILPLRFSALWHEDSKALEIIYTAVPYDADLNERNFRFRFRDHDYSCSFETRKQQTDIYRSGIRSAWPVGVRAQAPLVVPLFLPLLKQEHVETLEWT